MRRFLKTLPALALLLFALPAWAAVDAPKQTTGVGCCELDFGEATAGRQQMAAFGTLNFDQDYVLTGISIQLRKVGSPTDNVRVSVFPWNGVSSAPYQDGAVLRTAEVDGSTLTTSMDWYDFTFATPLLVSAGDDIGIQLSRSGALNDSNYYRMRGNGSDSDGPADTQLSAYYSGSAWSTSAPAGNYAFYEYLGDPYVEPQCYLEAASQAALPDGTPTIYARGTCVSFFPTTAWLGAVRIDPVGSHLAWSEGFGPFPDPYTLETTDGLDQAVSNGTWRVRMYARDGETEYVSGYIDVVVDGDPYLFLTDTGTPGEWELDPNDALLTASTTGETGYYFSASTAAIVAAGGLVITPDGCAAVGEDATSTGCVFLNEGNWLTRAFPLLTWPTGIFQAFYDAASNTENASTAYSVSLPSHGDWIPEVVVVDSASRTLGIGAYIPVSAQEFFRSILTFGVWVAFVYRLRSYANRLV